MLDRKAAGLRCIPEVRSCRQSPVYQVFVFRWNRQRGGRGVRPGVPLESSLVDLRRGGVGEGRMRSLGVIEVEPVGDGPLGGEVVGQLVRYTASYLSERQSGSMKMLSMHRPRPSMEMATPASLRVAVNSRLVNWLPWSVLKISGRP